MENFRDKMRETFSTPNKTNSGRKVPKQSTQVPFWGVLEWFVGCGGGEIPAEMALERVWQ